MRKTIYIHLLDQMADWEIGYILQALQLQTYAKNNITYQVQTLSYHKETIVTAGGLTITPDYAFDELDETDMVAILLPGANTWSNTKHDNLRLQLPHYLKQGILVAAICGATTVLADQGMLNYHKHTSNSLDFLSMSTPAYHGQLYYRDVPAIQDKNLITAGSAGSLLWARYILEYLELYSKECILAWYQYFYTAKPSYFTELMRLLMK